MNPITVDVELTGVIPLDGSHRVSTWVFVPERPAGRVPFAEEAKGESRIVAGLSPAHRATR